MSLDLDAIRACLEGAIPGVLATCGADGLPNVSYVSEVEYVDAQHLALSFQFFNKTRRNVLANPAVALLVVHPQTGCMYRLAGRYLHTQTEGPLFERMKAKLAGIASHTGMDGVFVLRGADVYAIDAVEPVGDAPPPSAGGPRQLAALRRCSQRLAACTDLDALVESLLDGVTQEFDIPHAMLLMLDEASQRLVTLASRGYAQGGAGAEIPLGAGVVGVAAQTGTAIRIHHATLEYSYGRTVRAAAEAGGLECEIPLPGLAHPGSQLAVPLHVGKQLMGVLFVESPEERRFSWDDEDALVSLAAQAAAQARGLMSCADAAPEEAGGGPEPAPRADEHTPLRVRYYEADGSVFLDDAYLIKGVAGALLWKILREHQAGGRCEFTNRELRLAEDLGLPGANDNLETRLLLLTRRLVEREASLRLERSGRGRFRLCRSRPLQLERVARP